MLPLVLLGCGDVRTECLSPLGPSDRNCDGRADDDVDGDGSKADVDCDDSRADLTVDDPDGDGSSTCAGDCDETSEVAAIRGPRGVVEERCDNVDNDCNDVIDVDDVGRSACEWVQPEPRPDRVELDLLFVVDSSGSMTEEAGRLPAAGEAFLPDLAGTDTHLGVVSNNNAQYQGRLHGATGGARYLELVDLDEETARAWWLDASDIPLAGNFPNAGLDAAFLALDASGVGETFNLGFRRDEAPLVVVFVSDSDDTSNVKEVDAFVPWIDGLEALAGSTTAYGILSNDIAECPGLAEVATDYQEAVTRTGGTFSSVCNGEWGTALSALASVEAPVSVIRVALDLVPIPATLEATVSTRGGLTDVIDAGALVFEPDPATPHVVVPQYLWADVDEVVVRYEVLPENWPY